MKPEQKKIFDQLRETFNRVDPLLADLVDVDNLASWFADELEISDFAKLCSPGTAHPTKEEEENEARAVARKALIAHFLKTEATFRRDEGNRYSTMAFHHGVEHQRFSNRDRRSVIAGVSDPDAKPEVKFHKIVGGLFTEMGVDLHKFAVDCDTETGKF